MKRTPLKAKSPLRRRSPLKARKPSGGTSTRPKPPKAAHGPLRRSKGPSKGDRVWKAWVVGGAGGRCERCGRGRTGWRVIDAHHVWGKQANPGLRHESLNGVALCRTPDGGGCHRRAHDNPKEFREWMGERFPEKMAALDARKREARC